MDYTANVANSEIDVDQIRTILVQGDATYPHIQFVLDPSLSGLSWKVRGYYRDFNIAVISDEITPTETEAEVTVDWYVSTDFTTYYGEMQLVLVGTDALGETVVKALGNVLIGRDFSISTTQVITQNLFEQLMAQLASACLKIDQTLPQTFVGGIPKLAADREISDDNELVDKKHVADVVATVTADDFAHNSLGSLQGGSSAERYHMTAAQNTALHAHSNKTALDAVAGVNTGDQAASSFNHNDLANKQGGTTNEFYHVTAAEKTVVANTSGTNTGDQDVSGAISTHNTDAGAHANLGIVDAGGYYDATTVEGALQEVASSLLARLSKEQITSLIGFADINKNLSQIDSTMLTPALLAQIAGTAGVNVTPALLSVLTGMISDHAVTPLKTSFFMPNKNKFNGTWVAGVIGSNGANADDGNSVRTPEYIPVLPNTRYTVSFTGITGITSYYFAFYDSSKTFISRLSGTVLTFTTPANTSFVRFAIYKAGSSGVGITPTTTQLELGGVATGYVTYDFAYVNNDYIDAINLQLKNSDINYPIKSICHRGYSTIAPENTLPAFRLAYEKGFLYVETDLRWTSDGVPVLHHDTTINATSNGTGNVVDLTFAQLRSYDFGSWKDSAYAGTQIPSFAEFILLCKKLNLHPYIELKTSISSAQAEILVNTVKNLGMLRRVSWIGGFVSLDMIRIYDTKARIGGLASAGEQPTSVSSLSGYISRITDVDNVFMDLDYSVITQSVSDICTEAGIPLEAYTVYTEATVTALGQLNVSGITTNGLNVKEILTR